MSDTKGIVLQHFADDITAPLILCESCGERVKDYKLAWVMWPSLLAPGQTVKPIFACKTNGCNSKSPYRDFASMELGEYLINLCRNAGMKSEGEFREALELARLADSV
jgi:hypothetical protein